MAKSTGHRRARKGEYGGKARHGTKSLHVGYCEFTKTTRQPKGKAQFASKKDARETARRYASDERPFMCDPGCGMWHLGHTGGLPREMHREAHALKVEGKL